MLVLFLMAVCIGLNAILACLEMAFVSVSKPELRQLARNGNRDATRILGLRKNPERTLSVIQIGGAGLDPSQLKFYANFLTPRPICRHPR